jgi:hypothetical protein
MTYHWWISNWYNNRPHERLGQAFVNDFFKTSCEGSAKLFHETDVNMADQMIRDWLESNHYDVNELPRVIQR